MFSIIEKHYRFNRDTLVKRVSFKLGSREDGEDAVQEAYARALKYSSAFEMGSHFNHWFLRILSNVVKDAISEKYNRANHVELDEEQVEGKEGEGWTKELLKLIEEEIEKVENEQHKEVLEFYFFGGLKHSEIVQLSPLTYHNIRYIIDMFKRRLREM